MAGCFRHGVLPVSAVSKRCLLCCLISGQYGLLEGVLLSVVKVFLFGLDACPKIFGVLVRVMD